MRRGFTLPEMMIVLMIIGIMAALAMSALSGAAEQAREKRTRAIIAKLDILIGEQYEGYKMRPVPIRIPAATPPLTAAQRRLYAVRELQRMELPCCRQDVLDNPVILASIPASTRAYRRKAKPGWTDGFEGAECLYLIVSNMRDGDRNAIDFFSDSEIGDTDGDGMLELLDGWGRPLIFLRWAPGFTQEGGALTTQTVEASDAFDPLKSDPRLQDADTTNDTFALHPLIYSMGPDGENGLQLIPGGFRYSQTSPPNDPYWGNTPAIGSVVLLPAAGDDITNHYAP